MATNQFNFLGLPLVVQDLITNEIVHNSFPEDRIQLALTSKYCNELVQRAKPKKIIDQFLIHRSCVYFWDDEGIYAKTKEQLMEISPNCQIKELQLCHNSTENYLEVLDMLSEATRFATKLDIMTVNHVYEDKIVEFYVKLKHLKSVTVKDPKLILPYYPSKVKLNFGIDRPGNILEDLAVKSQNCPLSFFELESRLSLEECQQFLQVNEIIGIFDVY
uniref:F-box domain-containing protein n=1 Tax=Panagrolaimus sp. JU765 TaxID=591449 RepID=A0AC34RRZ1_9BILA